MRVLAWAGAPLPLFRPSRAGRCGRCASGSARHARSVARSTRQERPLHCHHEKTIVDRRPGRVRRRDRPDRRGGRSLRHAATTRRAPASAGTTRCALIEGPAVPTSPSTSGMRWREVTGETLPAPSRPGRRRATSSCRSCARSPRRIYTRCRAASSASSSPTSARSARRERFIYLENQFLWSPEIVADPARQAPPAPRDDFRLAARAAGEAEQRRRRHARRARRADRGRRRRRTPARLHALRPRRAASPTRSTSTPRSAIVDDGWLTVGSANLNEHSLFNDTEMNIVTHDAGLARETRLRLWAEHLELPVDEIPATPTRRSTSSGNRSAPSNSSAATRA